MRVDLKRDPPKPADIKRAIALRREKMPWRDIGKRLGFSVATLRKAIRESKKEN